MDWIIIFLLCFGLAFDVFSIAVSQGSVLGAVKVRRLILMCLIVCAWQLISTLIGYGIASLVHINQYNEDIQGVWSLVSATIFIASGGIKVFLVQRRKAVPEVCADIDFRRICGIAASTSIYTLFVALGCGFLMLDIIEIAASVCVLTVGIVISGVFVGYRNGELNKKMYWTGGIFLIGAGAFVAMEYFTKVIGG